MTRTLIALISKTSFSPEENELILCMIRVFSKRYVPLKERKGEQEAGNRIMWFNSADKVCHKMIFNKKLFQNGLVKISDVFLR